MEIKKMKVGDMSDNQKMVITKKQLIDMCSEQSVDAVSEFIKQCGEVAEANWCPAHVDMLERLFNAVLKGEQYAPEPEEE